MSDIEMLMPKMGESIAENFATYRECFENPAEFLGDVESI